MTAVKSERDIEIKSVQQTSKKQRFSSHEKTYAAGLHATKTCSYAIVAK